MKFPIQNTIQNLAKPNLLRFLFLFLVTGILIFQISKLELSWNYLLKSLLEINYFYLLLAIALIVPNYYFEIQKWKILSNNLEQRSFSQATHEVLRGLKLGIITPLMIGDYVGRSMDFTNENKGSAVVLNLYNSFTQTWTSLLFGTAALSLWYFTDSSEIREIILLPLLLISTASVLGLAFLGGVKFSFLKKWKLTQKYISDFNLSFRVRKNILSLSVLRTIVYNIQYIFFYKAFGIYLSYSLYFIGVNILLLVKTIGGGLNTLGDLSIRELVSINFFSLYSIDKRSVLIATFAVWFFNIFVPVIIGIFFKPKS